MVIVYSSSSMGLVTRFSSGEGCFGQWLKHGAWKRYKTRNMIKVEMKEKDSNCSLTHSIPGTVSDSADSSLRSISPCLFYCQTSLRQVKYFAFSFRGKTSVSLFNRTIIQACFQQVTKAVGRSLWRGINQDSLGGKKGVIGFIAPAMLSNDSSLQDPFFLEMFFRYFVWISCRRLKFVHLQ